MVDADLKGYFDSIPHERLMALVAGSISDGRVLSLIELFLTEAGHHERDGALDAGGGHPPRVKPGARLQGPSCRRCWRTSTCIRSTS